MATFVKKTTTLTKFGVRGTGEALYSLEQKKQTLFEGSGPGILSPHTKSFSAGL